MARCPTGCPPSGHLSLDCPGTLTALPLVCDLRETAVWGPRAPRPFRERCPPPTRVPYWSRGPEGQPAACFTGHPLFLRAGTTLLPSRVWPTGGGEASLSSHDPSSLFTTCSRGHTPLLTCLLSAVPPFDHMITPCSRGHTPCSRDHSLTWPHLCSLNPPSGSPFPQDSARGGLPGHLCPLPQEERPCCAGATVGVSARARVHAGLGVGQG